MNTKFCPKCQAQVRDGETYCSNCQSPITNQHSSFDEENTIISSRDSSGLQAPSESTQQLQIPLLIIGVLVIEVIFFAITFSVTGNYQASAGTTSNIGNANRSMSSSYSGSNYSYSATPKPTQYTTSMTNTDSSSTEIGREGYLTENLNIRSAPNRTAEVWGTHYQNAKIRILAVESYSTTEGYSTWYKIRVLSYGCDSQNSSTCGKNWERNGNFGWMEGSDEGWMNAKYISLN